MSFRLPLAASLAALMLAACSADINLRGNAPDPEYLALIKPGAQNRDQVIQLLGSPTTISTFDDNTIYYISQRTKVVAFRKPEILSRDIVVITFGADGRVAEVQKFDLTDARQVELVERTTPTPGRQFSLLQQLIGNFGRFEDGPPGSSRPTGRAPGQ